VRELVTTLLDTAGLLLLAAGTTGACWPYIGPASLAPGGVVVLAGSWLASRGAKS
jgi:hypothetical protein